MGIITKLYKVPLEVPPNISSTFSPKLPPNPLRNSTTPTSKMDPFKAEKLQAMNKFKKALFLKNLIHYSLTVLICALFCSFPLWFPPLSSSLNHFVFVSVPNLKSFFFNPKCLFIISNVIIAILVGESKLVGSSSYRTTEIYDEYVERSQSLREAPLKKEGKLEMNLTEESVNRIEEDDYVIEKEKGEEPIPDDHEEEEEEEEAENGLPAEELNRRVEDFIARVNRQRWLEATVDL